MGIEKWLRSCRKKTWKSARQAFEIFRANGVEFWAGERLKFSGKAIKIFRQAANKRIDCSRRIIKRLIINSNQSNN